MKDKLYNAFLKLYDLEKDSFRRFDFEQDLVRDFCKKLADTALSVIKDPASPTQNKPKIVSCPSCGNKIGFTFDHRAIAINTSLGSSWEDYHSFYGLGHHEYEKGDTVSRDGSDEHVIESIDYGSGCMTVRCTKEPDEKWTNVGETEFNLIRRYQLVRKGK